MKTEQMSKEKLYCENSAIQEHCLVVVKKQWQTVSGTGLCSLILNHSKEVMVCEKCGTMVDPFEETNG